MSSRQLSPSWAFVHDLIERFPNTPSLTLAKKVMSDHPEMFTTFEAARTAIRYFRGASGNKARKYASRNLARDFDEALFNPFRLPASDEAEFLPYVLPSDCSRVLGLYDIHVPYHSVDALTAAIQYGLDKRADTIFLCGDFLDFYSLSSFEKDPRRRSFKEELKTALELLEILRREFPKARIFYQLGNHEERFERFLRVKAPELLDMEEFRLENLLDFERLGIELIDQKRVAKLGRLNLVHAHHQPAAERHPRDAQHRGASGSGQRQVEIRPIMYVALSYDHRIIDGKESVSFLVAVKEMLEHPKRMLFGSKDPMEVLLGL